MVWEGVVPKKFLCRYDLRLGATAFGIIMIIAMIACIIAAIIEMLTFTTCEDMSYSVKRSAYAFSVLSIIYSAIMAAINIWFIWAVKKNKASVILVWVVVTTVWLIQTTVLMVVLLCLYTADTNFAAWILCLVLGFIAFVICVYGVLVGYGLWIELKTSGQVANS